MSIFSSIFGSQGQLGIDLGTSFIKIVELTKEGGGAKLKNYALAGLSSFKRDFLKLSEKEVSDIIQKIIKEAGIKSTKTNMSVPLFSSFSTIIEMPFLPEKELAKAIAFEARQYIPVSVDDVSLEWVILSTDETKKKTQVLLMAVPNEIVTKYSQIAKGAGLNLQGLEIESFSLLRSITAKNNQGVYCFVDIGHRSTNIVVVDNGWVVISHSYEVGGSELNRALEQSLNISEERAEALKNTIGLIGEKEDREISSLMFFSIDKILGEIQRTLSAYYKERDKKVEKIFVSGGMAYLKGLPEYFNNQLGIETTLVDSFTRVAYPAVLKPAVKELNPMLSIAVGLAMHNL